MNKILIVAGALLLLVLLTGCCKTCYDNCIEVYQNTKQEYAVSECLGMNTQTNSGYMCVRQPTQELKEFCFNECKPGVINNGSQ